MSDADITGQLIVRKTGKTVDGRAIYAVFGMVAGGEAIDLDDGQHVVQGCDLGDFITLSIVKGMSVSMDDLPSEYEGQRFKHMTYDQLMTSKIWRV